jgi:SPP1 family phage portal protein
MDMYQQQDIGTIDFEVATDNGVSGIMYELEYADENNQVLTAPVDADTCVIAYDDSVQHRKLWAIIFKTSTDVITTDNPNGVVSMQVYTATQIIKYENSNKKLLKTDELPHYFTKVPVVRFRNNRKETGDFEKVIGLIDAYNLSLSDRVNDKVQLVEAILVAYGFDITKEQMQAIKDGRLLTNLPKPQDAKAEFLVKQLNETDVDILRRVLADDIHKISMIPNITDKEFAGNSSGVALKFKLLAFEQVVLKKERYFEVGLLERFELYNIYLAQLKQMPLIPKYKIDAIFKRNLPQNDYEISQTIVNLDGKVDDVTLVGQLSFVEDAQATVELAQKQAQKKAVESAKQFGLPVNGADPMQTKPTGDNNADDASVE